MCRDIKYSEKLYQVYSEKLDQYISPKLYNTLKKLEDPQHIDINLSTFLNNNLRTDGTIDIKSHLQTTNIYLDRLYLNFLSKNKSVR